MLAETRRLAGSGDRLWDLYCGYGLFAVALSPRFASVVGVEASAEAVDCARANAAAGAGAESAGGACAFHHLRITGPALARLFAGAPAADEAVILDPPYAGAPAPVLLAAGARRARRIVHVFCNTGRIPADAAVWRKAGYRIAEIVPLDMFPGTPELETLVSLEPGAPPHRRVSPPR
jgi:tRNA/tmRNA/rRNA uracil-C5-methylase (TrmA/RlmC/RlmD family)